MKIKNSSRIFKFCCQCVIMKITHIVICVNTLNETQYFLDIQIIFSVYKIVYEEKTTSYTILSHCFFFDYILNQISYNVNCGLYFSANILTIFNITSTAFSIVWTEINSFTLCPFWQPENIFGQGIPIKEMVTPSVPPRIGFSCVSTPARRIASLATSIISGNSSTFSRILK